MNEQQEDDQSLRENAPFLVPILKPKQRIDLGIVICLWLAALFFFWTWWLQPEHSVEPVRFILESAILAWLSFCPSYFIAIFFFGKIPNPDVPVPRGLRVAMVVTKAPSEPFSVARETLQAMLRQTYAHDTWLADEDPDPQTIEWCRANGVRVSTRKGRTDYHCTTWPRRTRCKEGNLAFFYDHYGYADYDFVSQLDADHVPEPTYLEEILRPFRDPAVGYVSAPSICDKNASVSWSARSRLYIEAPMHGAMQAGYSNGLTPLCIGSHYAVRTAALKEIGGLGPELAEDHSTTLMMASHGWRGVHAMNAIAHGDGPTNFADMVTQEFQWSRSLVTILLQYTPLLIGRLPLRLKFQFLFCQFWYPLLSLTFLAMFVIPVAALSFDITMANVTYADFLLHAAPPALLLTALIIRLAGYGHCRPADARVLSWEAALYPLIRWPWVLVGSAMAVRDWATGAAVEFRVTPKGAVARTALPIRVVVPFIVVALGSVLPAILLGDIQNARGFYFIAILNGLFYTLLILVIYVRHSLENRRPDGAATAERAAVAPGKIGLAWPAALAAVIVAPVVAAALRLPAGMAAITEGVDEVIEPFGSIQWVLAACGALAMLQILQTTLRRLAARRPAAAGALAGSLVHAGIAADAEHPVPQVAVSGRPERLDDLQHARMAADAFNRRLRNVADILVAWKAVDASALGAGLDMQHEKGLSISRILARHGGADAETIAEAISAEAGLRRVALPAAMLATYAALLSQDMCIRHRVFPAGRDEDGRLIVAVAAPLDDRALAEIAEAAGRGVAQRIARECEIVAGLRLLRGAKTGFAGPHARRVPLLGELLVEDGHVEPAIFRSAMQRYTPSRDGRLGDYLVQSGIVTRATISNALSTQRELRLAA